MGTVTLSGVMTCDICADTICTTYEPDALTTCADDTRIHCETHPCHPCAAAYWADGDDR